MRDLRDNPLVAAAVYLSVLVVGVAGSVALGRETPPDGDTITSTTSQPSTTQPTTSHRPTTTTWYQATTTTRIVARTSAPKPPINCHPAYSGRCVPIASDVDCAGGSGNGPAYVSGPVYVDGADPYDLDRDSDGVGCE